MNNKLIYIFLLGIIVMFGSCENYDDIIPSYYDKILSLKEVGEKNLTLYETGEDGFYTLTVMKGGNNPNATANVQLRVMNEVELEVHSQLIGKSYTLLPSSMYDIAEPNINFSSEEKYSSRNIVFKTTLINELLDESTDNFVLPVVLYSENDSINAEKDLLILKPNVVTPVVSYVANSATLSISGAQSTYEFKMELPFESLWDFTCTIEVDKDGLPSGIELVPASDVTIENDGILTFKKGSRQSEPLKITIKNADFFGSNYSLPLKVADITMAGFELPNSSFLLYAAYNKIALGKEMLLTNAQESTEGPLENLVDNNPASYFHSSWSKAIPEAHYFQISLKEPISKFQFAYQNRNNANGKPQDVTIFVSNDGVTWKDVQNINTGLPVDPASSYTSSVINSDSSLRYFRFTVNKTNGGSAPIFFSLAEFVLYGK